MTRLLNGGLAAWLAWDVFRTLQGLSHSGRGEGCVSFLVGGALTATAWFVLRRPAARRSDVSVPALLLVSATLACPLLFLLRPAVPASPPVLALKIAAALLLLAASISLGSAFAVLPAARNVTTGGAYKLMRHPIYAAYLIFGLADWLSLGDFAGFAIWLMEAILLDLRAGVEERLLLHEAAYREYRRTVRWRLFPGIR